MVANINFLKITNVLHKQKQKAGTIKITKVEFTVQGMTKYLENTVVLEE